METKITVLDKLPHHQDKIPRKNVVYEKGDILLRDDVEKVFKKNGPFATIYHLASAMPDKSVSDNETWDISVLGTRNVAVSAVKHKAKSFIFTSSNVTYGVPDSLPVTEDTPVNPIEAYGKSKVQAEKELEKFKLDMNIQIFRCPVITGVGRLGLQAILFEFISENRNVYLLGSGENTYQFVDANDVTLALELSSHKFLPLTGLISVKYRLSQAGLSFAKIVLNENKHKTNTKSIVEAFLQFIISNLKRMT